MKKRTMTRRCGHGLVWLTAIVAGSFGVLAQDEDAAKQKMAAIQQSLKTSMATLRGYEWIETTTIRVKGEQKSQKQNRCYYGADGKEVKVPIEGGDSGGGKNPRGIRGRVVKNKKEEMGDYVKSAMALVKQYIPPDPERMQAVRDKGANSTTVMDNATRIRGEFPDYLKSGDVMAIDIDPDADRIVGISVSSYIDDDPKDVVKLNVTFGSFPDGTVYPEKIDLNGESKKLDVVIVNDGYRENGS